MDNAVLAAVITAGGAIVGLGVAKFTTRDPWEVRQYKGIKQDADLLGALPTDVAGRNEFRRHLEESLVEYTKRRRRIATYDTTDPALIEERRRWRRDRAIIGTVAYVACLFGSAVAGAIALTTSSAVSAFIALGVGSLLFIIGIACGLAVGDWWSERITEGVKTVWHELKGDQKTRRPLATQSPSVKPDNPPEQ